MNLLLHICCAPCSTATVETWRLAGVDLTGVFFNPNIHPHKEHQQRYDTLLDYAGRIELPLIGEPQYDVASWLKDVQGRERKGERCRICIGERLRHTAGLAAAGGYDGFSTTLLVSPYQEHDIIREEGESAADEHRVEFHYRDLRPRYQRSVGLSREVGLYRQNYCGCIYSEAEAVAERARARAERQQKRRPGQPRVQDD